MAKEYPVVATMSVLRPRSLITVLICIVIALLIVLPFGITFSPPLPSFQVGALKSVMFYGKRHQEPWPLDKAAFSR